MVLTPQFLGRLLELHRSCLVSQCFYLTYGDRANKSSLLHAQITLDIEQVGSTIRLVRCTTRNENQITDRNQTFIKEQNHVRYPRSNR